MKVRELLTWGLWRLRWVLAALLVPLLVASVLLMPRIGVDNAVHVWFVEGDPALLAYDAFQEAFGNDEVVVLAVHHEGGILSDEGVARLRAVTDAAAATEGIAGVTSLATLTHVRVAEDWEPNPWEAPPIEVAPVLGGDLSRLRARVAEDPLVRDLLSEDGRTTLVLAQMATLDDMDARRDGILRELVYNVENAAGPVPMAGIGVIFSALNQASARDAVGVGSVSYLVIFGLLWLVLRRFAPVAVTLGVILVSAVLMLGAFGAFDRDFNMVTMALPTLLLITGTADCVHMFRHSVDRHERDPDERAVRTVADVLWPCLFTSLTTAAGFASLATARMQVVRDLGTFAALGVLIAFGVSLVAVLIALRWPQTRPRPRSTAALQGALVRLGEAAMRRRKEVLALSAMAVLVGAWGISRLEVDTYSIDYFYDAHAVRQDSTFIERAYGPYTPLELVVEAEGGVRRAEVLAAVAAWQDRMEADPAVGATRSVADVVRRLNQVLTDGSAAGYRVPPDDTALEQALLVYESDPDADVGDLVDAGWKRARVTAFVKMMSAREIGATIARLEAMAELPEGVRIVPSGYLPLYVQMMDYVVRSQVTSFAVAFVVIFALLAFLFGSLRMALLAVPPNLLPLFVTLGVMGIAGIRLDVATVTIAAIVLGLVVDDTIHFLYRYREVLRETGDAEASVRETLRSSGVSMAITSVVLVTGFTLLGLATVKSVAFFGLLSAVAMATALVGDLVMLPALLVTLRPRL